MMKHIAVGCVLLSAVASQAQVAFDTFGTGNSTGGSGWGFGDLDDTRIASQFTSASTGTLSAITMRLQRSSTPANATITIFQDSGNNIGAAMARFSVRVSTGGLVTIRSSNPNNQLIAGRKYWLEVKTTVAGSGLYSGWSWNNRTIRGLIKFGKAAGQKPSYAVGNGVLPAFRVEVARPRLIP